MQEKKNLVAAVLWLWVIGATASYLHQFIHLVEPIVRVLAGS